MRLGADSRRWLGALAMAGGLLVGGCGSGGEPVEAASVVDRTTLAIGLPVPESAGAGPGVAGSDSTGASARSGSDTVAGGAANGMTGGSTAGGGNAGSGSIGSGATGSSNTGGSVGGGTTGGSGSGNASGSGGTTGGSMGGGTGGNPPSGGSTAIVAPSAGPASLAVAVPHPKSLSFAWSSTADATSYQLERQVGASTWVADGATVSGTTKDVAVPVHLTDWANTRWRVQACNSAGCAVSPAQAQATAAAVLDAIAYVKASNPGTSDQFGQSLALSADGTTLVIGVPNEDSNATGVDGTQSDNSATNSGAVYVFSRNRSGAWTQQAYVKASNTEANDAFGSSVALSADGSTLAVGAKFEASNATGIDGAQSNNSANSAGAVYVFTRNSGTWTQQAYVKASNTGASDLFGTSVALSASGDTLAVGASGEASNATGIGGSQSNDSAFGAGAVYVFMRTGGTWAQEAYLKASNTGGGDQFGGNVALSADGITLAVAAPAEDSSATGVDGSQSDNSVTEAGAVYVFTRDGGGTWAQQAYVKASNTGLVNQFGFSLAFAGDGNTLAVGANREGSNAIGVNGAQSNNSAPVSGAVYVFARSGSTWSQQAYVKASNTEANDQFGTRVALSTDGNTLAVSAVGEDSNATGVGGTQPDNTASNAGAVYVFVRSGGTWSQQSYVKAANTEANDAFGRSVALSADGDLLAVGATGEASNATGLGGNRNDNSVNAAGAVYLY